ncbi:hypothetical protein F66182_9743 [Fusarium sp. NRRL 66182]|nr:hypothetical protein F66182_9743 [Fusarium sp. NRRL 66182]
MLWMGSQRLTYQRDERNKYMSRRAHHLTHLVEARRLKTIAIHLPESGKKVMRRNHEPPHLIEFMAEQTCAQPNFKRFRSLRTLQGLDYLHCLRGLEQITFWDYDKWRMGHGKVPVRDWTFVRDVNDVVKREKASRRAHFSQLRFVAPILPGSRPDAALVRALENILNPPEPGVAALPTPPPDDGVRYPHPQSAVDLSDDEVDSDDSDDEDQSESEDGSDGENSDGEDTDSDDDEDGYDGAVGPVGGVVSHAAGAQSPEPNGAGGVEEDIQLQSLQDLINEAGPGDEEQKYVPEQSPTAWSFEGGEVIDLTDDDGNNMVDAVDPGQIVKPPSPVPGPVHAPEQQLNGDEGSLFVTSPPLERREEFVTKVESPSPSAKSPSAVPSRLRSNTRTIRGEVAPTRQVRGESSLFCSPTPYESLVPQAEDPDSPSENMMVDTTLGPSIERSSDLGQRKRSRDTSSGRNEEEDEYKSEDDDDCRFVKSSPKRRRPDDGGGDGAGASQRSFGLGFA